MGNDFIEVIYLVGNKIIISILIKINLMKFSYLLEKLV